MNRRLSRVITKPSFFCASCFLAFALLLVSKPVLALEPSVFMTDVQREVLEQLTGGDIGVEERESRFRALFRKYFDSETIGRFVVGRYWRRASDEDKAAFLQTFEDILVQRFLPLMADKPDQTFKFGESRRDTRTDDMHLLASEVLRENGEPYRVTWRLKEVGDSYQILDIIPEGVSMAQTFRSEYGSFLKANKGNLLKLNEVLRSKLK